MDRSWYYWDGKVLVLRVRVVPRSSRDEIAGPYGDHLKIRLTTAPVDGKANRDLIRFLARQFRVPPNRVELISGASARSKKIHITRPARLLEGIDPPPS